MSQGFYKCQKYNKEQDTSLTFVELTGFPGGASGKVLPESAGDIRDVGSIRGAGRSLGGGHGHPLEYSCLENSMERGAWWATVHRAAKSRTRLK